MKHYLVDPALMKFETYNKENLKDEIAKFIKSYIQFVHLVLEQGYNILMGSNLYLEMLKISPTLPFEIETLGDYIDKDTVYMLRQLTFKLNDKVVPVDVQSSCNPEAASLEDCDNVLYYDFFSTLLLKCGSAGYNHCFQIQSSIMTSDNSLLSSSNQLTLSCEKHPIKNCFQLFEYDLVRFRLWEERFHKEIIENRLKRHFNSLAYTDYEICASSDGDHHPVFRGKIKSLDDVPNPERKLFIELGSIVYINNIAFRDFSYKKVEYPVASLINFRELISSSKKYKRVSCMLVLEDRPNKPKTVNIDFDIDSDSYNLIYSHINNRELKYLDIETVRYYLSLIDN